MPGYGNDLPKPLKFFPNVGRMNYADMSKFCSLNGGKIPLTTSAGNPLYDPDQTKGGKVAL